VTSPPGSRHPLPILLYHSVAADPPAWIAPYTVSPATFRQHLDLVVASGRTPLTISQLVDGLNGRSTLPDHAVVITFDDGFADTLTVAAPELAAHDLPATAYVTTGALERAGGTRSATRLRPARMLDWNDLEDLEALGVEVGSHSHTHPPLDVIPRSKAFTEIAHSKAVLEEALGHAVRSFAYPHGFYDRRVAQMVATAGYDSGAAVRNALSSSADDPLALARLMVRDDTPVSTVELWLAGDGAEVAPFPVRMRTRAWRCQRRLKEISRFRRSPLGDPGLIASVLPDADVVHQNG
jgi:peptidoglycan/xylan/chitin deacetylase (PgdA/CDA1 family)